MKKISALPNVYRITVFKEGGLWSSRIWYHGRYLWTAPMLYESRREARNAAALAAREHHKQQA